jgi:LuxR family maltose regulon positive regulatory protein
MLVCAPAGYGKTTTIVAALQDLQIESIWYKLDVLDHDPVVFVTSLVEAFRRHLPGFGQEILDRLRYAHESPISLEQLAALFVAECGEHVAAETHVVIDDYHEAADSPDLNRALDYLLTNAPANLRFIVLSRYDPAFPTGKMRLADQVSVLGVELLRFDARQAGLVLETRAGLRFAPEDVERLIQLTEGWPASVVLAGLALDWLDLDSLEQALGDPRMKRDIYSYLAEQVYRNEDRETRRFLDRTCCLEHVTEKLANRLVGIDDAHRSLNHLTANRVFTFADEPGAYRYHNLFREYLRHNYVHEHGEAALRTLQRESAAALEDSGEVEMAVELLFNANEQPAALEVLARAGESGLDNFRTESLLSWLQRLSRELRSDEPWARLLSSQVHMRAGDLDAALADIEAAVVTCEAAGDEWGLYHALSAKECVLFWKGDLEEAVATCEMALSHASSEAQRLHSFLSMGSASLDRRDWVTARTAFAAARELAQYASAEELARAHALRAHNDYFRGDFRKALSESPTVDWSSMAPTLASSILNTKGLIETGLANYATSLGLFEEAQGIAHRFGLSLSTAILTANAGVAMSGQGRAEEGLLAVRRAMTLSEASDADPVLIAYALCDEGTILRRCGQGADALTRFRRAETLVSMGRDPSLALSLTANLLFTAALAGDGDGRGLLEVAATAQTAGLHYVSLAAEIYGGILAAEMLPKDGSRILAGCIPQQLRLGHIDLLAQELCPRPGVALFALRMMTEPSERSALLAALAHHWRFADLFDHLVEEEPSLLSDAFGAAVKHGRDGVVDRVLARAAAAPGHSLDAAVEQVMLRRGDPQHVAEPRLPELTNREQEVLGLMAQGLRNPDIAARLFLSIATVKTHVNHIFYKLGVDSRVQAVLKYRKLEHSERQETAAPTRGVNPTTTKYPAQV